MDLKDTDLVFLAGGRGTRIANITKKIPKPLITFYKIPFIKHLLNYYSKYNFKKIYILTGYKGNKFLIYNKKKINLIEIECIKEKKKLGTGGALWQLKKKIKKDFILVNSDSFIDYNLDNFLKKKLKKNELGKIILTKKYNYLSNKKLSKLGLNNNGKITYNGKLMNAGVYYFKKKIFKYLKNKNISLEQEILPQLIQNNKVAGYKVNKFFIDIGTYKKLKLAKKYLIKYFKKKSAFLDRDGVINVDNGYIYKIKDFILKKNILKALKYLNKNNINIFIITNQAGIAKNYFSEKIFIKFSKTIKNKFLKKKIYINDIRYCPYHPLAIIRKYKKKSNFRKPGNLMIEDIKKNWIIDKKKSFMIGDKISDKLAAKKSKIYFEYVQNNIFKQVKKINLEKM